MGRTHSSASKECILHNAVLTEDLVTIKSVLSKDILIDINHYTPDGFTSLHQACIVGNVASVHLLIEAGADFNLWTRQQQTNDSCLVLASMNGNFEVAEYLLSIGAEDNAIRDGISKKTSRAHTFSLT